MNDFRHLKIPQKIIGKNANQNYFYRYMNLLGDSKGLHQRYGKGWLDS